METNPARGPFGLMRPLRQSSTLTDADRIVFDERCHFVRRDGGDGFLGVITAAGLIASAVIMALD
jgi:hypothetical protein